jgi:hypothetical protein
MIKPHNLNKSAPNIIKSNLSYIVGALGGYFLHDYLIVKYGADFDLIKAVSENLELLGAGSAFTLFTYIYENNRQKKM